MAVTMQRALAESPAVPESDRRSLPMVATLLAVAAGTMLFGSLLGGYLAAREAADAWPPDDVVLPNVPLVVAYGTLLMSSFTAQWSVAAIRMGDRRQMYVAIGITLLLGLAFLNAMAFCWSQMALGAGSSTFATHMYAVTIAHAVAVVTALLLFLVMGFRALGGQFSPANRGFVAAAATYWHFVVAVGAVVWFTIWFLEGGP